MISKEMYNAINEQINKELYSAYLYQSMSAYCADEGLKGFANWLSVQKQEETFHADKFYDYLLDQGEKPVLLTITQPPSDFKSVKDIFEQTLEHEKKVTASINSLVAQAQKDNDFATLTMLQWFVTEQVEEEASASDILAQLKYAGTEGGGLFMLDKELAARVFTPPTAAE